MSGNEHLIALAASWDENAAEERSILRSPNVTVEEAHTCEPVARAWEAAAEELRAAMRSTTTTDEEAS